MSVLALLTRPSLDAPPSRESPQPFDLVDPGLPHLSVLDLAATRGDGVFETISARFGTPHALDAHLRRFARSSALLDLPAPDLEAWRAAILAVAAGLADVSEATLKVVLSRGVEGSGAPTGWVHGAPAPDFTSARTQGIRVVFLDRGFRHDVEQTSPWLLAGAKTLSYAVNRAVLREANRRGADDVIFVSSDGYVLEGPTSTVLFRVGDRLLTPGTGLGILEGTTQGDVFTWAESEGFDTGFALLRPEDLAAADALWLVSSGRHAAPVRELDGAPVHVDAELTARINAQLLQRQD